MDELVAYANSLICEVHQKHAEASVESGNLGVRTCCKEFHESSATLIKKKYSELSINSAKDQIGSKIKSLGKVRIGRR